MQYMNMRNHRKLLVTARDRWACRLHRRHEHQQGQLRSQVHAGAHSGRPLPCDGPGRRPHARGVCGGLGIHGGRGAGG
jgi:hypothetical protein